MAKIQLTNEANLNDQQTKRLEQEEEKLQNVEPTQPAEPFSSNQNDELFENLNYLSQLNRETQVMQHVDEDGPENYRVEFLDVPDA